MSVRLLPSQAQLLEQMVDAARGRPRTDQEFQMICAPTMGSGAIGKCGLQGAGFAPTTVMSQDVWAIAQAGLLDGTRHNDHVSTFLVTNAGFEWCEARRAAEIATVQIETAGLPHRSATLRELGAEYRRRLWRDVPRAAAGAVVTGSLAFVAGGQIGIAVAYAVVPGLFFGIAAFVLMLVRAVTRLEHQRDNALETSEYMGRKIGVHKAIYGAVDGCEMRLAQMTGNRAEIELNGLVTSVTGSICSYSFYPTVLVAQVTDIAYKDQSTPAAERLERLIAKLKKNLIEGVYLV